MTYANARVPRLIAGLVSEDDLLSLHVAEDKLLSLHCAGQTHNASTGASRDRQPTEPEDHGRSVPDAISIHLIPELMHQHTGWLPPKEIAGWDGTYVPEYSTVQEIKPGHVRADTRKAMHWMHPCALDRGKPHELHLKRNQDAMC